MRVSFARLSILLAMLSFLVGCGTGPHPRLSGLLGNEVSQHPQPDPAWPAVERVGLAVHSDATGLKAAPPISQSFLGTLRRRTEKFLTQRCQVSSVVPIAFPSSTQPAQIRQELMLRGPEQGISHILLVIFSGREHSGPVKLGEEHMMTQMSGTVVENTTVVEVAVLDLSEYRVVMVVPASATETLEYLDAPIGKDRPTLDQSLDILRAQAGQQALDRSLNVFGQWCEGIPEKE